MKRLFFIPIFLTVFANLFSQTCQLSPEARRYMIQAQEAMKIAENESDFQMAAEKFEKALEYAADCADIYKNLAIVYGLHLGETKGYPAFNKAERYAKAYKGLKPADATTADDLLAKIEVRKEKYEKDQAKKRQQEREEKIKLLKESIIGTWSDKKGDPYITVNIDEQGRLWSKVAVVYYYRHHEWYENGTRSSQYKLHREEEKVLYWNMDTEPISLTYTRIHHMDKDPYNGAKSEISYTYYNNRMEWSSEYSVRAYNINQSWKETLYRE